MLYFGWGFETGMREREREGSRELILGGSDGNSVKCVIHCVID